MKIKTVVSRYADEFDKEVNAAMEEGWNLTLRKLSRTLSDESVDYLYAELVMPDPVRAPTAPWKAIRAIKEFCDGIDIHDCMEDRCPLHNWCDQLKRGEDPTGWVLPEAEPEA